MRNLIRALACTLLLAALPALSQAALFISVSIAPPALPVYELPPEPGPGFIWTPGYWAWDGYEYYWVPGTWVLAPVGLLWTPGYWGWIEGAFVWHEGYWGPQVGFYGGVDYGFGYPGEGYRGGEWRGREFVRNRTIINNVTINRVSYNGGQGGTFARPNDREVRVAREHHVAPIPMQRQQEQMAAHNREMRASVNGGRPPIAATPRPGVFSGAGVIAARNARDGGFRAAERPNERPRGNAPAPRGNSFAPPRGSGSAEPQREPPRSGFRTPQQAEERVPPARPQAMRPQETRPQEMRSRSQEMRPQEMRPMPQARPPQPQRAERPQPQERPPQREQRPPQGDQRDERPQHQARIQQARPERMAMRAPQGPERMARPQQAGPQPQRMARAPEPHPQRQARSDSGAEHRHG